MDKGNWTYRKLGEVAEIINGKNQKSVETVNGKYPICGSGGVMGYASDYLCPENTIIIGRKGNINNPIFMKEKFWNVDTAFGIVANDSVNPKFLFYFCKDYDFEKHNVAVTIPSLRKMDLLEISVPVPPLEIQSRIVAELDCISSILEKKRQQLKELDNLAQAIFYDMFGDPVENEKGWEVKKLGEECLEIRYGTSKPAVENGKYGYLRMGNLTSSGHLDLSDLKTIDIPDDEIEKCIVRKGDILFNRTNSLELIGKTCMFDLEEPMVIAGYIIRVRLKSTLHPRFVAVLFNLPSMKKTLRKMAKGAVNQANINSKELASIPIILPPLSLQQSFAAKIEAIEKQKERISQSIKEVQTLFDSRMEEYFG